MLILSIDHSFSRTGYSLLDNYKLLATGSFCVGTMSYENIMAFQERVDNLIKTHKPEIVITEKPAHMRNGDIARMLTSLHTVIILACLRNNTAYYIVNPKIMKKLVTGKGNATKEDVCNVLIEKYKFPEEYLCHKEYYKKDKTKVKEIYYDESDSVGNAISYLIERGTKFE